MDRERSFMIGEYSQKRYFHYITVSMDGEENILRRGRLIEDATDNKDFLLIPLKEELTGDIHRNYDVILWSTEEKITDVYTNLFIEQIRKLRNAIGHNFCKATHFCLNNGKTMAFAQGIEVNLLGSGNVNLLISHTYENQKYKYRITTSANFHNSIKMMLEKEGNKTVFLDLSFNGRSTESTYNLNSYKIKEHYEEATGLIVLSNVKGVIDLSQITNTRATFSSVVLCNFLLDWKAPFSDVNSPIYPSYLKIINFYPAKVIKTSELGHFYFKNYYLNTSCDIDMIIPEDREKINEMFNIFYSRGNRTAQAFALKKKRTLEEEIQEFEKNRWKQDETEFRQKKRDRLFNIASLERDIQSVKERIMILEYKTKSFIPFPKIVLPDNPKPDDYLSIEIEKMLKKKDNQYYIEQE